MNRCYSHFFIGSIPLPEVFRKTEPPEQGGLGGKVVG